MKTSHCEKNSAKQFEYIQNDWFIRFIFYVFVENNDRMGIPYHYNIKSWYFNKKKKKIFETMASVKGRTNKNHNALQSQKIKQPKKNGMPI